MVASGKAGRGVTGSQGKVMPGATYWDMAWHEVERRSMAKLGVADEAT